MRIREVAAVGIALVAAQAAPAAAQRTGDQARIVFTVSGAYVKGRGLWTVPRQPLQDFPLVDSLRLDRNITSTFGAGFSGAYFRGEHFGLTADFMLLGLGFKDSCRIEGSVASEHNAEICRDLDDRERSAGAVTVSAGAIARIASRDFISPFVRANVGLLFSNQSSIVTRGFTDDGVQVTIYEDDQNTRVNPSFALGLGTTIAISPSYHLRWELRDNIVGVETVTGPAVPVGSEPPHERRYRHMLSFLVGIDVVLERSRGRRY
jgi:opacity protein-like surface antigen